MPDPNRTSVQALYYEARARAIEQGVESADQYADMVEELLVQKLADGVLDKHDDLSQLQKDLEMMWPDIKQKIQR